MKHLLIIITFQLFTFNLYAQSSEIGVLYQFKSSSGLVWKTFGQDKVQPKYEGEVSNGVPDGFGVLSYPFSYGKSVVGEWKIGKEWYTEHYNKEGTLLGKYVNGEWILKWGVLFHHSKKDGIEGWYEDGDEKKDRKYVGDITNGKPNGQGTETSPEGEKYEGEWKDGKKEGQGKFVQVDEVSSSFSFVSSSVFSFAFGVGFSFIIKSFKNVRLTLIVGNQITIKQTRSNNLVPIEPIIPLSHILLS